MVTHILQAVGAIIAADDKTIHCLELHLILRNTFRGGEGKHDLSVTAEVDDETPPSLTCCILGIPTDMNEEDIQNFVEAYSAEILSLTLISEERAVCVQKVAVLVFRDVSSLQAFCELYNDLHFPDFYDRPPCVVIPIQSFDILEIKETVRPSTPVIFETMQLPNCPMCIRRLASYLPNPTRMPLLPSHRGNESNCAVCRAYSQPAHAADRICCADCGLGENIWVCMLCARGGCGRYTYTHAKGHYHVTRHPFSLELATGRIWNYVHDAFIHHEDPLAGYDERLSTAPYTVQNRCSSDKLGSCPHASDMQGSMYASRVSAVLTTLDDASTQKINNVVSYYESLLQSQLTDQSIYYEKLLARKTVQLLEREVLGEVAEKATSEKAVVHLERGLSDQRGNLMIEIERAKLEISVLEQDYARLVNRLRESEEAARQGRIENKAHMNIQKSMQSRTAQLKLMTAEVNGKKSQKVAELKEQIRDMNFFIQTQRQVAASGMKDDIQQGNVVVLPVEDAVARSVGKGKKRNSSGSRR